MIEQSKQYNQQYNQNKSKGNNVYIVTSTYIKVKDLSKGLILRDFKRINNIANFHNICWLLVLLSIDNYVLKTKKSALKLIPWSLPLVIRHFVKKIPSNNIWDTFILLLYVTPAPRFCLQILYGLTSLAILSQLSTPSRFCQKCNIFSVPKICRLSTWHIIVLFLFTLTIFPFI